jgi:hypothetical protein
MGATSTKELGSQHRSFKLLRLSARYQLIDYVVEFIIGHSKAASCMKHTKWASRGVTPVSRQMRNAKSVLFAFTMPAY